MEQRGWVCLNDYGGNAVVLGQQTAWVQAAVVLVQAVGTELQRAPAGWDESLRRATPGVWAPAFAAPLLPLLGLLSHNSLDRALRYAKDDRVFAAAVDAAFRLGGEVAALDVVWGVLPMLPEFKTRVTEA
jgi:hypothetical protein